MTTKTKTTTKKTAAKKSAAKKTATVTIVDIAKELNMSAKVARAKLRRKGKAANEGRWPTYKKGSAEHKEIKELLSEGRDKKS